MSRIDRYVLREAFPPFVFGLVMYVVLLLISNLLGQAKWIVGFPFWGIVKWLWYQVPLVLNQTMPVALMLAVLLAFGRLARENELLVMQAGGVPLLRVARWIFVAAVLMTGVGLYLAEYVVPKANAKVTLIWWDELATRGRGLSRLVGQDVPMGPYRLFFKGYDSTRGEMRSVRLERWDDTKLSVVLAERGKLAGNRLTLWGYRVYNLDLAALEVASGDSEAVLKDLVRSVLKPQDPGGKLVLKLPKTREELIARNAGELWGDTQSISYWWRRIQETRGSPRDQVEARVMFHSDLALPFANLIVVVLSLPLAVRKATGTSLAFGYSLIVTILYYLLMTAGKIFALGGSIPPELAAWGPNLIALGLGLWWMRSFGR